MNIHTCVVNIFVFEIFCNGVTHFTGLMPVCCNPVMAFKFFLKMKQKETYFCGKLWFCLTFLFPFEEKKLASFVEVTSGKL